MQAGAIESMRYPRNPLDVLAQQIVAMVALDAVDRRRAGRARPPARAPFAALPDSALDVGARHAGRALPLRRVRRAAAAAGLGPGHRHAHRPAGRAAAGGHQRRHDPRPRPVRRLPRRRRGRAAAAGSASWTRRWSTSRGSATCSCSARRPGGSRTSPTTGCWSPRRPGSPGQMPFWKGDAPGRPVELGRALGAFLREVGSATPRGGRRGPGRPGWTSGARPTCWPTWPSSRRPPATCPTTARCWSSGSATSSATGGWSCTRRSGRQVNAPWALAIAARLRERYGVDVAVHALRRRHRAAAARHRPASRPAADLAVFDPDEIERDGHRRGRRLGAVRVAGSGSAPPGRCCCPGATRAGARPLWQQRQRAAQLLQVASEYGSFPIVLEAMRECLQDVFDVPGLVGLMRDVAVPAGPRRRGRDADSRRRSPSRCCSATSGMFLYEGDAPLAERRAQALSLDTALLAELLGRPELRELLDADAMAEVEAELQRLPARAARRATSTAPPTCCAVLGDLTDGRGRRPRRAAGVAGRAGGDARRAIGVRIAGEERLRRDRGRRPAARRAGHRRCRSGCRRSFTEPVADPLGDLVARYARTHGPFQPAEAAARLGLGVAVVAATLQRLTATGRLVTGEFRPGGSGQEWCDAEVLRSIRRRSLAKLRQEVEPVPIGTLARFTAVLAGGRRPAARHATASSRRRAAGRALVPASAAGDARPARPGSRLLPRDARRADQRRRGAVGRGRRRCPAATAGSASSPPTWPRCCCPSRWRSPTEVRRPMLDAARRRPGAVLPRPLRPRGRHRRHRDGRRCVWDLVWAGVLTNDTLAPLRTRLGGGGTHRSRPAAPRARAGGPATAGRGSAGRPCPRRTGPPTVAGRWSRLPEREAERDPADARARTEALLERHGVLTRGAVMAEQVAGGFSGGLPGAAGVRGERPGPARLLRRDARRGPVRHARARSTGCAPSPRPDRVPGGAVVLAATDPANVYGAALPWPDRPAAGDPEAVDVGEGTARAGSRPATARAARPAHSSSWSTASWCSTSSAAARRCCRGPRTSTSSRRRPTALSSAVSAGALGRMVVQKADGESVHTSTPLSAALQAAGFAATPRGLRLRA